MRTIEITLVKYNSISIREAVFKLEKKNIVKGETLEVEETVELFTLNKGYIQDTPLTCTVATVSKDHYTLKLHLFRKTYY